MYGLQEKGKNIVMRFQSPLVYLQSLCLEICLKLIHVAVSIYPSESYIIILSYRMFQQRSSFIYVVQRMQGS